MIELGGMVAISIGWQPDGDLCGYGQPLDDTAVLVVRYADYHEDSSFSIPPFLLDNRSSQR
jgi:hypothetical protein